jgi:hypothetical protein
VRLSSIRLSILILWVVPLHVISVNPSGFTAFIIRLFTVWIGSSLDCDSRSGIIIIFVLSFFLSVQNSNGSWSWLGWWGFSRRFAGLNWQNFDYLPFLMGLNW